VPDVTLPDHYEVLQLSPRADRDTIERVFRHLAKQIHPDNPDTGNAERFSQVLEAFQVLSDPESRARYDAGYEERRETRWRAFTAAAVDSGPEADSRMRSSILALLYRARRNDPDRPGVGTVELERLLDCPEEHMKFHIWYLRENGWVERLDTGMLAITASGVDRAMEGSEDGGAGALRLRSASGGDRAKRASA
jgi:curved DNA-binding protein CbpA